MKAHAWLGLTLTLVAAGCDVSLSDLFGHHPPPGGGPPPAPTSHFLDFHAPAGDRPATRSVMIDGRDTAVLPDGRLVTPVGTEIGVEAPKPFGLAVSPDGRTAATINSGSSHFSVTLLHGLDGPAHQVSRVELDATFMGLVFSRDGNLFYASGGENGNVWVGETQTGKVIGSVNLNGAAHPLDRPLAPATHPTKAFKGAFPGNMALTGDGRYLYVVDQGAFQVVVIDAGQILTGADDQGRTAEPDNFAAVVGHVPTGRYPFGIALAPDDRRLYVTNVGVFQYTHLRPETPTGDSNKDYPLCIPGAGYPDETEDDRTIKVKKIDARTISGLPTSLRDPEGVRCGYVDADRDYTIPGLGSPNVPQSSSVYIFDLGAPASPVLLTPPVKTGRLVGEVEQGLAAYGASHPNSVAVGRAYVYVANGNNDSITVLDAVSLHPVGEVSLSFLDGLDRRLRGIQPVALALAPDEHTLYVAEAGVNAVSVVALHGSSGTVRGRIPAGWWPSSVKLSADGKTLFVANAKGRGAGPNLENLAPKHSVLGTVQVIPVPAAEQLRDWTRLVLADNGFVSAVAKTDGAGDKNPIPAKFGAPSRQIKHVIFINKENSTHDQLLGDIVATRAGAPVAGDPTLALDPAASPNHHELALSFAFGDNFFLEPAVSSDGHRWLTDTYTSEFEETHWPASYGGRRNDSGNDPEIIANWPGRIGFTDANSSPEPHDYNQHGGIYLHLDRHGRDFVNFGNGFEFALVDEDRLTEPTGIREHANVPMEKVVRDNTDHLFPEFNTAIPDAPLPENPDRFNRFGRFQQIFEAHYVDRGAGECKLPAYVDLYYPNDHGGGANDINGPGGAPWDFKRFVQDNDAALGATVELISHSPCWKDTVIFVSEDDTQNGLDHVDGYRTIFLAISPWVKRQYVSKTHLSLASIFKTVYLVLGLPPLNLHDAAATDLRDLFTGTPDFTPYDLQGIAYARKANRQWARLTAGIDFAEPDAEEVNLRTAILKSEGIPHKRVDHPTRRTR